MYLDNSNISRNGWKYTYKGSELLSFAETKLQQKCREEQEARTRVIELTRDTTVSPNDRKVDEAKRDVERAATVVEELMVHVHQFRREMDREFHLSMGDVVFFGLIDMTIQRQVREAIAPQI